MGRDVSKIDAEAKGANPCNSPPTNSTSIVAACAVVREEEEREGDEKKGVTDVELLRGRVNGGIMHSMVNWEGVGRRVAIPLHNTRRFSSMLGVADERLLSSIDNTQRKTGVGETDVEDKVEVKTPPLPSGGYKILANSCKKFTPLNVNTEEEEEEEGEGVSVVLELASFVDSIWRTEGETCWIVPRQELK